MPRTIDVGPIAGVRDDAITAVEVEGARIILVRDGEAVYALQGICSHEGYPLEMAELEPPLLTCALHYSCFDVRDGHVVDPPATLPLASYPVDVIDGRIVLVLPDGSIPMNRSD
jgi:3-phenylpropionate/trans-cinnamate dioxygenase ferredoxin component